MTLTLTTPKLLRQRPSRELPGVQILDTSYPDVLNAMMEMAKEANDMVSNANPKCDMYG